MRIEIHNYLPKKRVRDAERTDYVYYDVAFTYAQQVGNATIRSVVNSVRALNRQDAEAQVLNMVKGRKDVRIVSTTMRPMSQQKRLAQVGDAAATLKVFKGTYYFPDYQSARSYAQSQGLPTDRIISYERGWAVQLRVSGPYAGPGE